MKCLFQGSRRWPSSPAWTGEAEEITPPPDDGLCAHLECVLLYVAQTLRALVPKEPV